MAFFGRKINDFDLEMGLLTGQGKIYKLWTYLG